jgi:hypothetical protein
MRLSAASAALLHEAFTDEVLVEGLGRGQGPLGVEGAETAEDLASSPRGSLLAELEGRLEDLRVGRVGAGMRPVGSVSEAVGAFELVAPEPLVAGLAADAVAAAQLGEREQAALGLNDESLAFGHGIGLQPGHGRLPKSVEMPPRYGSRLSPIRGE